MWHVVGIRVGLLRHHGEVEGVVVKAGWAAVVKDDAFWNSASVAAHAMLKRISQNDEDTMVFQVYFSAGCCDMRNLSASFARP